MLYDVSLCGPFLGWASTEMELLTRFPIRCQFLPLKGYFGARMWSYTFDECIRVNCTYPSRWLDARIPRNTVH
ncbi:hypothetical protein Patl1_22427 [Pistacia atlantica]|uniref:Uncharacterized protein n=1 Tax=Pistacia atlantica TaxID=434234 RepID=A0ACC1A306_9ROSI|nr:hypothetical protein Patl1_22427 [Pistacia atlantica]